MDHERHEKKQLNDRPSSQEFGGWYWLICLLVLLPLLAMFFLHGDADADRTGAGGLWLWMMFAMFAVLTWWLITSATSSERHTHPGHGGHEEHDETEALQMLSLDEVPGAVAAVMDVRLATQQAGVRVYRGPLRVSADEAERRLIDGLAPAAIPMLQEDEQLGAAIVAVPRPVERASLERPGRPWLSGLLFLATLLTTTWAGAAHQGVDILAEPGRFAVGLPYALGLLAILGVHELGHFFTARYHGIRVTPPYFIPLPFALGTFGAFIKMKSPTPSRRALFDVAVAGPLAGLVVAIPALLIGLSSSQILPDAGEAAVQATGGHMSMAGGTSVGSSILFALAAKLTMGDAVQYGHLVRLTPLAFAGWLGLFVTALNLLPVGQLDGGHMARAMFGTRRGQSLSTVALWTLVLLALFVWPGLLMFVLIIFFLVGRGIPPLNDLTPLGTGRRIVGYATFAILLLIVAPLPHAFWQSWGIHCPYL